MPKHNALIALYIWKVVLYTHLREMHAAVGKEMNKERHDVLSISSYVIKENPATEPDMGDLFGSACITRHMKC